MACLQLFLTVSVLVVWVFWVSCAPSCQGDQCAVISKENITENYALIGQVINTVSKAYDMFCEEMCWLDCRCRSVNQKGDLCELNSEDHTTLPYSLRPLSGSMYYSVKITNEEQCPQEPCENFCCLSNPCHNQVGCSEVCDQPQRINCTCPPQHFGSLCQINATSCHEVPSMIQRREISLKTDPDGLGSFTVHCDTFTSEGGWTLFQRRTDGSVDFYQDWNSYKEGFGSSVEFWLGNERIHRLTATGDFTLRIDMEDFDGVKRYAEYQNFRLDNEANKYKIHFGQFSGDVEFDAFTRHNGLPFSTKDRENDPSGSAHCAQDYTGAYWYSDCIDSNLNGVYYDGGTQPKFGVGINWRDWPNKSDRQYSLKKVEMKFRPTSFVPF